MEASAERPRARHQLHRRHAIARRDHTRRTGYGRRENESLVAYYSRFLVARRSPAAPRPSASRRVPARKGFERDLAPLSGRRRALVVVFDSIGTRRLPGG